MNRTTFFRVMYRAWAILACALVAGCASSAPRSADQAAPSSATAGLAKINHVVVLYLENRSFDNLYGEFPGADGIVGLRPEQYRQVDTAGVHYKVLPQAPDSHLPDTLPNAPFAIEDFLASDMPTRDLVHRFYQQQAQIDGGRMHRFVAVSDAAGLTMGYYHTAALPLAKEALKYTLADHFFHGTFGGSFLNHFFLVSASVPVFPNAPPAARVQFDRAGRMVKDGFVSRDGHVVNTAFSINPPNPSWVATEMLVPSQTMPTIGDRLSDKKISWAWYSGGWNDAIAGRPDSLFQFHHQPFVYFAKYAEGTPARAEHLKDESDFVQAARDGTLPAVAFVKPIGANNEHPGYADLVSGERHTLELIDAVRNGPNWHDTAIIVTYDENGGFWDHVGPPTIDKWGPGVRVPTIIISPYARMGFIDHTTYDTSSILALIEHRFGLEPLGTRDAAAKDLTAAFDFTRQ